MKNETKVKEVVGMGLEPTPPTVKAVALPTKVKGRQMPITFKKKRRS